MFQHPNGFRTTVQAGLLALLGFTLCACEQGPQRVQPAKGETISIHADPTQADLPVVVVTATRGDNVQPAS